MECKTIVLKFVSHLSLCHLSLCHLSLCLLIGISVAFDNAALLRSQDLIQPAPEMPAFTLGQVSQSRDISGRPSVTIDYQRTKEGVGVPTLAGRTARGSLKLMGGRLIDDAVGKIDISGLFLAGKGLDAELYLVVSGSFADQCPYQCLVSNVVRVGNFGGPAASAREWTDKENDAYQKDLIGRKPPISPPSGYQLVQAGTKLLPGMPVKVGRFGDWVDAEVLTSESPVTVKIAGLDSLRKLTRNGWMAVLPSTLQQGDASPGSFKASAIVIPGTTLELPAGYVVVADISGIVPGTPVRVDWNNMLVDATVIASEADKLLIHFDSQPSSMNSKVARRSVIIAESTLEQLNKPDAAQQFESRLPKNGPVEFESPVPLRANETEFKPIAQVETDLSPIAAPNLPGDGRFGIVNPNSNAPRTLTIQNSPIGLPIPKEAELVPLDFPLPRGTKLAACSGGRWTYVTVIKDSTDDNVPIHWDDRTSDSDGLIHRSQLIIRRLDLKKLRAKAAKPEKRDWTDSTGKYKVDAKLTARTATHVTLAKSDGKEVTLPIEKLSSADQQWLKDNP